MDLSERERALLSLRRIGSALYLFGLVCLVFLCTVGASRARAYWQDQWWVGYGNGNDAWALLYFLAVVAVVITAAGLLVSYAGEVSRVQMRAAITVAIFVSATVIIAIARETVQVPISG